MLKSIAGVIAGWIAMAIVFFLLFTGVYLALGSERSFQPNTYMVSNLWLVLHIIICILGSYVGGVVCAKISKRPGAGVALAIVVVVFSVLSCLPYLTGDNTPKPRPAEVPNLEAMQNAQMPTFMYILTPLFSAAVIVFASRKTLSGQAI